MSEGQGSPQGVKGGVVLAVKALSKPWRQKGFEVGKICLRQRLGVVSSLVFGGSVIGQGAGPLAVDSQAATSDKVNSRVGERAVGSCEFRIKFPGLDGPISEYGWMGVAGLSGEQPAGVVSGRPVRNPETVHDANGSVEGLPKEPGGEQADHASSDDQDIGRVWQGRITGALEEPPFFEREVLEPDRLDFHGCDVSEESGLEMRQVGRCCASRRMAFCESPAWLDEIGNTRVRS